MTVWVVTHWGEFVGLFSSRARIDDWCRRQSRYRREDLVVRACEEDALFWAVVKPAEVTAGSEGFPP